MSATAACNSSATPSRGLDLDQINPIYLSLGSHLNDLVANPFYGVVQTGMLAAPTGQPRTTAAAVSAVHQRDSAVLERVVLHLPRAAGAVLKRFSHGLQFEASYAGRRSWKRIESSGQLQHPGGPVGDKLRHHSPVRARATSTSCRSAAAGISARTCRRGRLDPRRMADQRHHDTSRAGHRSRSARAM